MNASDYREYQYSIVTDYAVMFSKIMVMVTMFYVHNHNIRPEQHQYRYNF